MKKLFNLILILALIGAGIYIYMTQKGHTLESILNTPNKIELKVSCSEIDNLVVTSSTVITVQNLYERTHNNIIVKVTAYDKDKNMIKQKNVLFDETLSPKGTLSKVVLLPAKAVSCECIVVDSNPI